VNGASDPTRKPKLEEGIAAILRIGTILSVLVIGIGFLVASMTGLPSRGARPLTDYVTRAGPDTPIAVGLVALTILPPVVLAYAAVVFGRAGERQRLATTLAVLALLGAGLAVAAVIGPAS
jgi:uncharacterized membrane protein